MFASVTQLVVPKSEFCSKTKFVEGTIQERRRSLLDDAIFNCGDGVVCEIQIPPFSAVAMTMLPSAEEAAAIQPKFGAVFSVQVAPEFVEERIPRSDTSTNLAPSAEDLTVHPKTEAGKPFDLQLFPEFVEV